MLNSLLTRIPFIHSAHNSRSVAARDEADDPGFDTFVATLRARRSSVEWCKPGPEGDQYRLMCLAEEMVLLSERNYGIGCGRVRIKVSL